MFAVLVYPNLNQIKKYFIKANEIKTITQIFIKVEVVDIDRFKEERNNIFETKELLTTIRLTCIYESMLPFVAISITGYLLLTEIQLLKCKNNYEFSTLKF